MNKLLDFNFNDENFVLSAILLAVEKAITSIDVIDNDLFRASHFCYGAIGTAKADLTDALYSLYNARSWAKEAIALADTPHDKLPYIDPLYTVIKLALMAKSIILQELRLPYPPLDDSEQNENEGAERKKLLSNSLHALENAVKAVETAAGLDSSAEKAG